MESNDQVAIEFSGLVLGFASAALSYMGIANDHQPSTPRNLVLARQNIGILDLLEKKTKGNLTPDEDKLIKEVVTDLKLKYSQCAKS